jgi:effector-binding domain-containing protein
MTVEFAFKKVPAIRVATLAWSGPWNEGKIRSQFGKVAAWAKAHGYRTGRWVFREPGDRRWEVGIELRGGSPRGSAPVRLKTLPATRVAFCVFDPDAVEAYVVYHGLNDWLRWRKKERKIRSVADSREVYSGDPWASASVWSRTEVQFVVRP